MSESQRKVVRSGTNNPMFGKTPTNAMVINVYSLDNVLVNSFSSQVAAAKWLNTSSSKNCIVMFVLAWYFKGLYYIKSSILS